MNVLRVSSQTDARALAGCIAGVIRENGRAEMQAIGAGAVNQATKAVAIAREFLVLDGLDITVQHRFGQVLIDGEKKTTMVFAILSKRL